MRPREMPSWSAWMTARTKFESSVASTRSAIFAQRGRAGLADADLAQHERELVDQRAVHVLGQLRDRGVEAEARLDADGEQVERVRQLDCGSPRGGLRVFIVRNQSGAMNADCAEHRDRSRTRERERADRGERGGRAATPPTVAAPLIARNVCGGQTLRQTPAATSFAWIDSTFVLRAELERDRGELDRGRREHALAEANELLLARPHAHAPVVGSRA